MFFFIYFIPVFMKCSDDLRGPFFLEELPNSVDFSNSTGIKIPCVVGGYPAPNIQWILRDDRPVNNIPGLRHTDANGTLIFLPFSAEDYRQDVHATLYKCMATNSLGTIISKPVKIRAGKP